jgi:hypothetical protein
MDESEELDVWEPQTTTVIHEFLRTGLLIEPLFHLPFLDLELRDSSGETLLLAACRSYETLNRDPLCSGAGNCYQNSPPRAYRPRETTMVKSFSII